MSCRGPDLGGHTLDGDRPALRPPPRTRRHARRAAQPRDRAAPRPGTGAALREIEPLAGALRDYHLLHAARAALLRALGRDREAQRADERALALAGNVAERALLQRRLARG
jgi:RNA polymerase sigma-70 factor (ECF subfamily)